MILEYFGNILIKLIANQMSMFSSFTVKIGLTLYDNMKLDATEACRCLRCLNACSL